MLPAPVSGGYAYGVVLASNGREATELAWEHSPKLILMDLRMPVIDGWEATRLLKADPETVDIPVPEPLGATLLFGSGLQRRMHLIRAHAVGRPRVDGAGSRMRVH